MKRLLKWVGWIMISLIVFMLAIFGVAYYYKAEIISTVKEKLSENVNGEIGFGDLDFSVIDEFPGVSVTFKDLYIRGPRYEEYAHDFLKAGKVYVKVELAPLLRKKIVIQSVRITQGEVYVFHTRSGYTNLDVFIRPKVTDTVRTGAPIDISFNHLRLEDVGFFYRDSVKGKMAGFRCLDVTNDISDTDSTLRYLVNGKIQFEGLTLNPDKGSYLKDKIVVVHWDIESTPSVRRLIINDSKMEFEKSTVQLSGAFDFREEGKFKLKINSERLDYPEGLSILTEKLRSKLNNFKIERPVKLQVLLDGKLKGGDPLVDVAFEFKDSPVMIYTTSIARISVVGEFINHMEPTGERGDEHSIIDIKNAVGIYQGFPVHLKARITRLDDPFIEADATIDTDFHELGKLQDTTDLRITGGKFKGNLVYAGKLKELSDTATVYTGTLNGFAQITDGAVQYLPRKHNYEKVNVSLRFDKTHVAIDSLSFVLNQSPILIKGEILGYVPMFVQPRNAVLVRLNVFSPSLNLSNLLSKAPSSKSKTAAKKTTKSPMERLYAKTKFEMDINVKKLIYNRLNGSNLTGKITLARNSVSAKNFSMNVADGNIGFSGTLGLAFNPLSPLYVSARVRNADIKKFFYSFDNFKLTSITHQNLEGKIDTDAVFWAWVNDEFTIYVPSVVSNVSLSIRQGRIINFEPLQNMSNFLLKRRDFSDVHFGEIRSRMSVRATEIDIQRMEIESSVLHLFLEGRYSMRDSTNLSVQLPLSNLKKKDKDDQLKNVGLDAKVGPSIFLHVYEEEGKISIAYDPFKKHVRKTPAIAKKSRQK